MSRPDRVVVVAGGLSFEREISLWSGRRVSEALLEAGFEVTVSDVDHALLGSLDDDAVVFLALHGPVGEDGSLQDILDASGIAYVGSPGDASRLAFDKPTAKAFARRHGMRTPPHVVIPGQTFRDLGAGRVLDRLGSFLGYPLIVKPARGGSALGVSVVQDRADMPNAMIKCFNHGDVALVESFVAGAEVSVGVIEGADASIVVLPPVEIVPVNGVYDFEARYDAGRTVYHVPARLSPESLLEICSAAQELHSAFGLRYMSRSDFIVDSEGHPHFLEITGAPGLTETGAMMLALRVGGISTAQIFAAFVDSVFERKAPRGGNSAA